MQTSRSCYFRRLLRLRHELRQEVFGLDSWLGLDEGSELYLLLNLNEDTKLHLLRIKDFGLLSLLSLASYIMLLSLLWFG